MSDYCFISGLLVGITFFISYLHQERYEEPLKPCVYLACMVSIFIIFIATVSIGLNLDGAFWFIHIINPIILVIYWFIFCDQRIMNWKGTFSVVLFPLLYLLFAFVLFKISGNCPFPANLIFLHDSGWIPLVMIVVLAILVWVLGFILHILNKSIRRNR